MSCITLFSSVVLLNGRHAYPFPLSRGIRQEDPLSPIFVSSARNTFQLRLIEHVRIPPGPPSPSIGKNSLCPTSSLTYDFLRRLIQNC